jgi:hypothetical protein
MTTTSPAPPIPTTTFAEAMNTPPPMDAGASTGAFTIRLSLNGVTQGYLGVNDGGWAILVDANDALSLEWYPYNGVNYIRQAGSTSSYMSVGQALGRNGYVGFYSWWTAGNAGWTLEGTHLVSAVNQQSMSIYSTDNGYIYCWNDYTVLDVTLES